MREDIISGLRYQLRQKMASQDTGERFDFGQDDVPPSTETGKKEVKEDATQVYGRWARKLRGSHLPAPVFPPTPLSPSLSLL